MKITAQEYVANTFEIIEEIEKTKLIKSLEEIKDEWEVKLTCSKTMKTHDVELILIRIDERIEVLSKN